MLGKLGKPNGGLGNKKKKVERATLKAPQKKTTPHGTSKKKGPTGDSKKRRPTNKQQRGFVFFKGRGGMCGDKRSRATSDTGGNPRPGYVGGETGGNRGGACELSRSTRGSITEEKGQPAVTL